MNPSGGVAPTSVAFLSAAYLGRPEPLIGNIGVVWRVPFTTDGRAVVVDEMVVVLNPESQEVRVYDRSGALERLIRTGSRYRPLSAAQGERFMEDSLAARSGVTLEMWSNMVRDVGLPDSVAAFSDLHVDPANRIWARWSPLPGDSLTAWTVYLNPGILEEGVAISANGEPLAIGHDHLALRTTDELGVEYVRVVPFSLNTSRAGDTP
jgi:hypothetical protein